MKTALILLAKDIGDKAVEAFRPVLAKFAAKRAKKLRAKGKK